MQMAKRPIALFLTAALALCLALPAAAAPAAPAGFDPAPLTDEEAAYSHVGPADAAVYARFAAADAADSAADSAAGDAAADSAATGESAADSAAAGDAALALFDALDSYNTQNAQLCYNFLTSQMGLNAAQASGILASMYTESRFDPAAIIPADSNGLTSYGLCQWNGPRYDALRSWCAANGYDYTTVAGQLRYLQYEVGSTEKRAWSYMQNIPNNADGAYTAGYNWARYFERGASRYWTSRAELARDEIWPVFGAASPVDPAKATAFVTRLYTVCLNRDPDAAGLANWVNALSARTSTGVQVAYGFAFSPEFGSRNYCNEDFVKQLYRAFMGREYDAPGLAYWVNRLETGAKREEVFNGFALSTEFTALCADYGITRGDGIAVPAYGTVPHGPCSVDGKTDGVTSFVTRLYGVCLERIPDAAGLADWTARLWNHTATGTGVAYGFVFSPEFSAAAADNTVFVTRLYRAVLGREPDAAGLADWAGQLNAGTADRARVFAGFAGSTEFDALCKTYGIAR